VLDKLTFVQTKSNTALYAPVISALSVQRHAPERALPGLAMVRIQLRDTLRASCVACSKSRMWSSRDRKPGRSDGQPTRHGRPEHLTRWLPPAARLLPAIPGQMGSHL
jgi:hypothetical protein